MSDDKTRPRRTPTTRPPAATTTHPKTPQLASNAPAESASLITQHAESSSPPALNFRFTNIPNWLSFWLPIVTSILALVVSVTTFIASNQDPDVHMILPDRLYMSQGSSDPAANFSQIYLEPSFVSTGYNDRLDVITNIKLRAEVLAGQSSSADFIWAEIGGWNYDTEQNNLTYVHLSLKRALLVSPSNPQLPVLLFQGPLGWNFNAGDYKITITAERAVGKTPLQSIVTATFAEDALNVVNDSKGDLFRSFPITP